MVRKQWQNLNGLWNYAVRQRSTPENNTAPETWNGKILVPYCIESSLSGVGHILQPSEELWYQRTFTIPKTNNRQLLHFEAVDYQCAVWVNGQSVGTHKGGSTPFSFDVTKAVVEGKNTVHVKVIDETADYQLRGKQVLRPHAIYYTRVSGVWQTVWLETVPRTYIKSVRIDTDAAKGTIDVNAEIDGDVDAAPGVKISASFEGREVGSASGSIKGTRLTVKDPKLWSPEKPNLYDLKVELIMGGQTVDAVESYAGIRSVGKQQDANGNWRFTLNGKEIFHLGTLDQGWFPDGLLTPASDKAMRFDIDYLKAAGYNCIRNHIKVRPRRYYAHCDRIGMMIWQDQVSGTPHPKWTRLQPNPEDKDWPDEAHEQYMYELKEMIDRLYNAPSIVSWVPFNEAWGQHRTLKVGKWTVDYDPSRLINVASGGNFWPVGDVVDHHNYPHPDFPVLDSRFKDYIKVVGEFGGHGFVVDKKHLWNPGAKNWGYGGLPKSKEELLGRYRESIRRLIQLKRQGLAGGIYTQTTDVEAEVNGLMTYDREVQKFAAKDLKQLHEKLYAAKLPGKPILPVAAKNKVPVRYTTTKPADDWIKPNFDDSGWKQGAAGLGLPGTKNANVKTVWNTPQVWIRTSFDYDPAKGKLLLNTFWDENPTIYINGVVAAKLEGYTTHYELREISKAAQASLKKGTNTLAIHCQNALGGQYIDVSVVYGSLGDGPRTGTFNETLNFGSTSMNIKARVPMVLPKEKALGLILAFHPHGGNENSMVNWPSKAFLERQGVLDDYVIIGLKSQGPQGYKEHLGDWETADHAPSYKTFQWAMNTYPIDPRRVHVIGWSRGGFMVTRFIWDNLENFATVTAYAGAHSSAWTRKSLGGYPNQDWVKLKWKDGKVNGKWTGGGFVYSIDFAAKSLRGFKKNNVELADSLPEFYHVHGDQDYVIDVNLTRSYTRELGKKGIRCIYRELDGVNHAGVFQGKPVNFTVNDDVFKWIHATRNKILLPSRTEKTTLAYIKGSISTLDRAKALELIKEAGRIGGAPAGEVLVRAFDSGDTQVRLAAVNSAMTTSYGPVFTEQLGKLITDKDPAIAKAAIRALGQYAQWRQLDAQAILNEASLKQSIDINTRGLIIAELGKIVELMKLGNMHDDRQIILTLVKLLDDPEQQVRLAAYTRLKSASQNSFAYSPDSTDRKEGLKNWNRWAAEATAPLLSNDFARKTP
jgi:beta-galactosidase